MSNAFVETCMKNAGIETGYQLASALNEDRRLIYRWLRGGMPDSENTLKLVKLGKLSIEEALNLVTSPAPCAKCGKVHVMQEQCILC